jgi:hypothetical protein
MDSGSIIPRRTRSWRATITIRDAPRDRNAKTSNASSCALLALFPAGTLP